MLRPTSVTATYTGWSTGAVTTALDGTSYSVTFTATTPGATAIATAADFMVSANTDGVNGSLAGTVGTAAGTKPWTFTTASVAGPGTGYDIIDFTGLGGDIAADFSNFNSLSAAKSVVVALQGTSNDTAAEIAALFTNAATATTHVYVAYTEGNVGNVYQMVDATGTTAANVATLMGTIDMADTQWSSLTAVNFV